MKGFTLLEVMIALAIMAGVVLTVISSFNWHLNQVGRDREETVAVLLARGKLEDPNLLSGEKTAGNFGPERPEVGWAVTTEATELPGLAKLTLTVTWGEGRRTLSLVKYVKK